MENKRDIYAELIEAFPIEDYSIDKSRGFALTSLKAQSIKERLNKVFGVFGWSFYEHFVEKESGVLCHGKLVVRNPLNQEEIREVQATGGCEFKEKSQTISDPYKSAATEALSKASSYIGIGNSMYKGLIDPKTLELDRGDFNKAVKAVKACKNNEQIEKLKLLMEQKKWDDSEVEQISELIKKQALSFVKEKK